MGTEATERQPNDDGQIEEWQRRCLDALAVGRTANTVRAYGADTRRWVAFCEAVRVHPFEARPWTTLAFVRAERERTHRAGAGISPRTIVRWLSAVRQWYGYLA